MSGAFREACGPVVSRETHVVAHQICTLGRIPELWMGEGGGLPVVLLELRDLGSSNCVYIVAV